MKAKSINRPADVTNHLRYYHHGLAENADLSIFADRQAAGNRAIAYASMIDKWACWLIDGSRVELYGGFPFCPSRLLHALLMSVQLGLPHSAELAATRDNLVEPWIKYCRRCIVHQCVC